MRAMLPGAMATILMVLIAFEASLPAKRVVRRSARETHRTSAERPVTSPPPRR